MSEVIESTVEYSFWLQRNPDKGPGVGAFWLFPAERSIIKPLFVFPRLLEGSTIETDHFVVDSIDDSIEVRPSFREAVRLAESMAGLAIPE